MKLLGEGNWYLPTWLEWLPTLAPEVANVGDRPPTTRRPPREMQLQ
jgi:hypothetical protein